MNINSRNVTPEKAQEILAKQGTIVSIEEAKKLLRITYDFAIIAAMQIERETKAAGLKKTRKPKSL